MTLFLIGFMASGKSSVGRLLAEQMGRRFVDLDDRVDIALLRRSESEFREREAQVLGEEIARATDNPIIATGGGAATYGDNLQRMRGAGCVIALAVDVDEARARAGEHSGRPLLERPAAEIAALAAARAPVYRRAHAVVDTNGKSIAEVTETVRAAEAAWLPNSTVVALGARSYPVTVSEEFPQLDGFSKLACVTDTNVAAHWRVKADVTIEIPPGEQHKTFATYQRVCDELIRAGLDRSSAIVALGGGVVGDLAGFVAATLFRGIPIAQLPTTVVAMTDAAIGGKTAIDTAAGKNLVGAFHQPRLVACNLQTLATLPARERRAGFGELWKYALLDSQALWTLVDQCTPWARDGGPPTVELREVIARSVAFKAAIVNRDETERTGQRAMLNLGHTVGHAIESESGLHHGEAVGLGLAIAARVSHALGMAPAALEMTIVDALRRTGLPHDVNAYLSESTIARISVDKKRVGKAVRFIAVREVGVCEPVEIQLEELGRILRSHTAT